MKTLVVGSTGLVGSRIVARLLKKGETIRCMSRSWDRIRDLPEGIERVAADLDRPHTLADACKNVDRIFLLLPIGENETDQGLNAVRAAAEQGVKRIVYLSVYMPRGSEIIPHFKSKIPVEQAVKESGIEYTILRPNSFFQNDIPIIGVVTGFGLYPIPLGSVGLNRVDVRDVADGAVNALTQPGYQGKTYPLHGPDALNAADTANVYSLHVGRDVRYAGDDLDAWAKHVRMVMTDRLRGDFQIMYRYFQDHGMIAPGADLEKQVALIGHAPRSFDMFARELAREWKKALACAA